MKHTAVILTFPYLIPAIIGLIVADIWNYATDAPPNTGWFFGGTVSVYYIVVPIVLILQIVVGVPGSLAIRRVPSRTAAIILGGIMAFLPLGIFQVNAKVELSDPASILPFAHIAGPFGAGSCVSFYFLRSRRQPDVVAVES